MMGAATEKARLPRFSLVLGIESCCEIDDRIEFPGSLPTNKAVSTQHFSELGAIDRDQFAPSCPCPHGGNWNARSGS